MQYPDFEEVLNYLLQGNQVNTVHRTEINEWI